MYTTSCHACILYKEHYISLSIAATAVPLEMTTQAAGLITVPTQTSSTISATAHNAKPEPFTHKTTEIISNITNDQSSKLLSGYLPWLLVGVLAMLFCSLLTANIVCCIVCTRKRHKRKQYKLKRNPSYVSSPTIVGTRNYAFENHIYDVPTST